MADEILPYYQAASADDGNQIAVRFSYERFCDHFVAEMLLEEFNNPADLFVGSAPLAGIKEHHTLFKMQGILDALSVIVPEKFDVELHDLLPNEARQNGEAVHCAFASGLARRTPDSFSDRTLLLLNELQPHLRESPYEFLLQVSTEPFHPWNAELLHKNLVRLSLTKRDTIWSTFVANSDYEEGDHSPDSSLRSIIEWATFGRLDEVGEDRAFLALIVLAWTTTTTKRRTRDHATKAIARIISLFPMLAEPLLDKFKEVNDLYVHERLYAGIYGGFCNTSNETFLEQTANWIFGQQFADETPTPHLLVRDFARGMIELCIHRGCLPEGINVEKCRPPYKSTWPIENPGVDEFKEYDRSDIETSVLSMLGDFGNYTIRCVSDWSPTELSKTKPQTQGEVLRLSLIHISEPTRPY